MSFRELRNFTEQLRALGYTRHVSMENFRTPNFLLVADILSWLVERYDPNIDLPEDISTERDRIEFLKAACQAMSTKARIRLNPKRLYAADGYAVKELLKISSVLHQATKASLQSESEDADSKLSDFNVQSRLSEVKSARSLASEIVESGAKVYDLLGKEPATRDARKQAERFLDAVSRNMDSNAESELIEQKLREQVDGVHTSVNSYSKMNRNLDDDEKNLEAKIEKKRKELERTQVRLKSLQSVRPQYMDEYEKMEVELSTLYVVYLERFRNLEYLDHELEQLNDAEKAQLEEADAKLKVMQQKLRNDELKMLRGDDMGSDADEDDDDDDKDMSAVYGRTGGGGMPPPRMDDDMDDLGMRSAQGSSGRPSAAQAGQVRPGTVHGSMTGGLEDDDSDSADSDDSAVLENHVKASGGGAGLGGHDKDDGSSDGGQLINDDDDDGSLNSDDLLDDDGDDTVSENDF